MEHLGLFLLGIVTLWLTTGLFTLALITRFGNISVWANNEKDRTAVVFLWPVPVLRLAASFLLDLASYLIEGWFRYWLNKRTKEEPSN